MSEIAHNESSFINVVIIIWENRSFYSERIESVADSSHIDGPQITTLLFIDLVIHPDGMLGCVRPNRIP